MIKNKQTRLPEVQRPTVGDLVKMTGYSQGAISLAINGQKGVSESTREKILKAAREIGYHPNPSARNFKRGYTARVGIILPNLRNANYSELYEQLDQVNREGGYSSTLALTHDSAKIEADTLLHWSAGETDALIVNPVEGGVNLDLYRKLKSWRYPIVFLYRRFDDEFDGVFVDYRMCLRQALIYLRDVGHQKVAYVGPSDMKERPTGKLYLLMEILKELGMGFDSELSVFNVSSTDAGARAFSQWGMQKRHPTAVVAYSDQVAISLYTDAIGLGMDIPGEMSLFGSDDIVGAKAIGLSTIRVDRSAMARTIVDVLRGRMQNFDSPVRVQAMPSELVLRRSMGPPKIRK